MNKELMLKVSAENTSLKIENSNLKKSISNLSNKNIEEIEINKIQKISNIRQSINVNGLESMEEFGQLQPLLITSDFYLIDGYRRLQKATNLKLDRVKVYKLEEDYESIKDNIQELQYHSNESRKSLDNFDISDFFYTYVEKDYTQEYIADKFKKSKALISTYLKLQHLDPKLKELVLQFQVYAYSYEKFNALTSDKIPFDTDDFYQTNKNMIIAIRVLYKIAKEKTSDLQKIVFVDFFKNRLTKKEIENLIGKEEQKAIQKPIGKIAFKKFISLIPINSDNPKFEIILQKARELEELINQEVF